MHIQIASAVFIPADLSVRGEWFNQFDTECTILLQIASSPEKNKKISIQFLRIAQEKFFWVPTFSGSLNGGETIVWSPSHGVRCEVHSLESLL